jgi:hypothetical protein
MPLPLTSRPKTKNPLPTSRTPPTGPPLQSLPLFRTIGGILYRIYDGLSLTILLPSALGVVRSGRYADGAVQGWGEWGVLCAERVD